MCPGWTYVTHRCNPDLDAVLDCRLNLKRKHAPWISDEEAFNLFGLWLVPLQETIIAHVAVLEEDWGNSNDDIARN